jgi:DNA-directed RNA polymerase specialized sigma subunit
VTATATPRGRGRRSGRTVLAAVEAPLVKTQEGAEDLPAVELADDASPEDADATDAYGLPERTPESDALIVNNLDLARCYARRMGLSTKFSAEDLHDAAVWGLIKAARTFDPSRGNKFSTHAVPKIVGTIKQWIRDYGYAVKFPHSWREYMPKVRRLAQSGKNAAEIVEEVGARAGSSSAILTEADVREMLHVSRQFKHWDEVLGLDSEPRVRNGRVLEDQEFEDAAELNGLYDLATRAWQRMEPGDRDAIVAGWNGKRRHVPGLPLGQFAVHVKGAIGRHQVRGEAELAPLGFSVERGIGGSKRPRRMAAAAGVDGEKLAEVVEQLGLGV